MPDAAVDAFAQQVGVSAVAGVLLHPMNPELTDGDVVLTDPRTKIRVRGQRGICRCLLASKTCECALDQRLVGNRSFEVVAPP